MEFGILFDVFKSTQFNEYMFSVPFMFFKTVLKFNDTNNVIVKITFFYF